MTYRPIKKAEIPVVSEIQSRAFRQPVERYITGYQGRGRVDWRSLRVLENGRGEAVAALGLFFREMSLNGGELEAGLVGGVAVLPEHRRRGYARQLMEGLLQELHDRETPLSLLFPFSVAWYGSLGYALANLSWGLELPVRLLPDFAERQYVRRGLSEDEPMLRRCYQQARQQPRHNGWLSRTDVEWRDRLLAKPEFDVAVYDRGQGIEGYLVHTLQWHTDPSPSRIVEWVATSDAAWRGLAAYLGSLAEQTGLLAYNAPQNDPLLFLLREPYDRTRSPVEFVFYPAGSLVNGFMLRVTHLGAALRQRRYPPQVQADLVLHVEDLQLPANSQPVRVTIADGRASVAYRAQEMAGIPSDSFGKSPKHVVTDASTFSQLYAGLITGEQARLLGRLQADDAGCAAVTAAFAASPLHMWQADWF